MKVSEIITNALKSTATPRNTTAATPQNTTEEIPTTIEEIVTTVEIPTTTEDEGVWEEVTPSTSPIIYGGPTRSYTNIQDMIWFPPNYDPYAYKAKPKIEAKNLFADIVYNPLATSTRWDD